MTDHDTLKNAVTVFERQFRCRVCLHDYMDKLPRGILPLYHLNPFCTGLKKKRPQWHGIAMRLLGNGLLETVLFPKKRLLI